MAKITYPQYSTIPLYFTFVNGASGTDQNIIFNVPAGTSLSSSTAGIVAWSVFNLGTTGIAISTLNGAPLSLTGLYAFALSSSGNAAVAQITEGLSGGTQYATGYTVVAQLKLDNPSGNSQFVSQVRYDFWVSGSINDLSIIN